MQRERLEDTRGDVENIYKVIGNLLLMRLRSPKQVIIRNFIPISVVQYQSFFFFLCPCYLISDQNNKCIQLESVLIVQRQHCVKYG